MTQRAGFTRIELLVVLGIVGFLCGVASIAVQRVRNAANRLSDT
jgi:type II secretory pathway pseudopilin PulG